MMTSVLGFSLAPLIIVAGGGEDSPFVVNLVWRVGVSAGYCCLLGVLWRRVFLSRRLWVVVAGRLAELGRLEGWRRMSCLAFPLAVVGNFDSALFGLSVRFSDVSVVAVLFEAWPVFYILISLRLLNTGALGVGAGRGGLGSWPVTVVVSLVALAGVALVLGSQHGLAGSGVAVVLLSWVQAPWAAVALGAALLGSFPVFSLRWGLELGRSVQGWFPRENPVSVGLCCITVTTMLANLVSMPFGVGLSLLTGESASLWLVQHGGSAWVLVSGGMLAYAVPTVLWRLANLLSLRSPGINALGFLVPVLSVTWLVLFWEETAVARWMPFVGGVVLIISANAVLSVLSWGRGGS